MPDTSRLVIPALTYAGRGWPVFMLARSKRPIANCPDCPKAEEDPAHNREACDCLTCHGFYAATTNPSRVAAIVNAVPTGQLALRTGAASATVVVDVDPRHGGHHTMNELIRRGLLPPTAYVITGSGGLHLYYRHPGTPVPCSQGKPGQGLGPGIDVKGDGGYVVLPPSVHPRTGRPYRWAPRNGCQVEEMPPALVTACQPAAPAPVTPHTTTSTRPAGGISFPDRLLAAHLHAVTTAPEGARRTTLYGAARGVARMVKADAISRDDAIAALTDAGRQAEQTDRDIRAAIRGGFRDEGLAA
ncbi:bifunctional DNA primase/polymerase [Micromonospora eburnea]|uniref:Bifunctional DNA primase/polymerase, N-terminal n=1 Tax=Micromonospora eburnea TaxID=227316 RepID=A0A1C6VPR3_9ACTN|nr:bifunctional DNA primase/polymerase [Micromonospora eburnea]SCL67920.1 Bifunctional DNA primase/polymerase, N-terminal [Micromonospora eburnea]